jgi:hypothetical protein
LALQIRLLSVLIHQRNLTDTSAAEKFVMDTITTTITIAAAQNLQKICAARSAKRQERERQQQQDTTTLNGN